MDDAERTHVITVECQTASTALKEKKRFFRDRYFKLPPLTEGDWAALGFRPKGQSCHGIYPPRRGKAVSDVTCERRSNLCVRGMLTYVNICSYI
ncbi:MAG: hypothetical protein LBK25_06895 [Treponema sp.]|jgi:hypothetical protein|nr:hypothetical protein [Treponema sp.]